MITSAVSVGKTELIYFSFLANAAYSVRIATKKQKGNIYARNVIKISNRILRFRWREGNERKEKRFVKTGKVLSNWDKIKFCLTIYLKKEIKNQKYFHLKMMINSNEKYLKI